MRVVSIPEAIAGAIVFSFPEASGGRRSRLKGGFGGGDHSLSALGTTQYGMRAALAELDESTFTEAHELDPKWRVPRAMIGRRLSQEEVKTLLTKLHGQACLIASSC